MITLHAFGASHLVLRTTVYCFTFSKTEQWFGLVWAEHSKFAEGALKLRDDLAALRMGRRRIDRWPGTQLIGHHAIVDT